MCRAWHDTVLRHLSSPSYHSGQNSSLTAPSPTHLTANREAGGGHAVNPGTLPAFLLLKKKVFHFSDTHQIFSPVFHLLSSIPFLPPPSCFLAPNSCHCARMGLNLTQMWMVHKKQLIAFYYYLFIYFSKCPSNRSSSSPSSRRSVSSPYDTTRGLISKPLLFLRDIHAPLNSSFTSAVRTKRDYRKQQWWNFPFSLTKGNLIEARGRRECLTSLHFFIDKVAKEIGCFQIRQNLVRSISFHGSGFSFWCLNWNGPPPHTHLWNILFLPPCKFSSPFPYLCSFWPVLF